MPKRWTLSAYAVLSICCMLFLATGCISTHKNIIYQDAADATNQSEQHLNIFEPSSSEPLNNVFIFVHGGGWDSGSPELYNFFGRKMARKGIVTVIISYPLSPSAEYNEMTTAVAKAVQWISKNIDRYGGDPEKIFVGGHSAGAHLASLAALDDRYFKSLQMQSPVQGLVLIDAAGLDMYNYLLRKNYDRTNTYIQTFTHDTTNWKDASPIYYLDETIPPMLIYRGGNTYESIESSTERFVDSLKNHEAEVTYHILEELDHIAMMAQFLFSSNVLYDEIINFMYTHSE